MLHAPLQKGLQQLKKELFSKQQVVGALVVDPQFLRDISTLRKEGSILSIPRLPSIVWSANDRKKMILLDENIDFSSIEALPMSLQKFVQKSNATLTKYSITLDYEYWSAEQILRSILPDELEVPSSFSTIGHIAHFNLRQEYAAYKNIIGDVILTKSKNIFTVVNKLDTIDHSFRFFEMELLAGKEDYIATVKESECQFTFDFSKVYWNSRLQGEHHRLISTFQMGEIVVDVFGGVGPFALPAAKLSKCFVFANDLNPISYKYLVQNIQDNKVKDRVKAFNVDGRKFIVESLKIVNEKESWKDFQQNVEIYMKQRRKGDRKDIVDNLDSELQRNPQHYIMNLPASAIEFLDAFVGLYHGKSIQKSQLPMIHCYCFSKALDKVKDVVDVFYIDVASRSNSREVG
jgi:tRNA (guanine37-N1)-methyltransferase